MTQPAPKDAAQNAASAIAGAPQPTPATMATAPVPAPASPAKGGAPVARRIARPGTHVASATPRTPRLTLSSVKRGRVRSPDKILMLGTPGVGKSTWAANAPAPIFICAEDGSDELDVARFPEPTSFLDVMDAITELTNGEHEYKTLVIDTVDWLEPLVIRYTCERCDFRNKDTGEFDVEAPGYGKGHDAVADDWRRFLASLDVLRAKRGMEVILIAHAGIKKFSNPEGEDFDRYEPKLGKRPTAMLTEWAKNVLFATHETLTSKSKTSQKHKGVSTGDRVVFTERTAAREAKNRYGLPPVIPLSRGEYERLRDEFFSDDAPAQTIARAIETRVVEALRAGKIDDDTAANVRQFASQHDNDVQALRAGLRRLDERIGAGNDN